VPRGWRGAVEHDLDDEAVQLVRGRLWREWQVARVGLSLRAEHGGSAMLFDLRMAMRSLWRAKWFTVGAVLTFAVGVGLNLAVFATVDRVLFRPLPYERPDELVLLRQCSEAGTCGGSWFPSRVAYEAQQSLTTIEEIAVVGRQARLSLTPPSGDEPRIALLGGSANLLRVLGVAPVLGRDVSDADVLEKRPIVLLEYDAWQRRFGGDAGVIGQPLWSGQSTATIIGVLPPGFQPPGWTSPVGEGLIVSHSGWATISPTGGITAPVARLRPGASAEAAQAEVQALADAVFERDPEPFADRRPFIRVDPLGSALFDRWSDYAMLVMGGASLVLVMACANLAGLFLARGRGRERDAALRTVLGATRARVIAATLVETTAVCVVGAGAALGTLQLLSAVIRAELPPVFVEFTTTTGDLRVLGFALSATFVAGLAGGLWPGLRASRRGIAEVLQRGGAASRGRLPGGRFLLAGQSLLCVCLIAGAAATVWSFERLMGEDLGFDPADLYVIDLRAPRVDGEAALATYRRVLETLETLPQSIAAAGSDNVVGSPSLAVRLFDADQVQGSRIEIDSGYLSAIGSHLLAGREFDRGEVAARAPVVVVGRRAAEALWPGASLPEVVGRTLQLPGETPRLVVGVAPELSRRYGDDPQPAIYVPLGDNPAIYDGVALRMRPGRAPDLAQVRERIAAAAPDWTVAAVRSAAVEVGASALDPRFRAVVLTTFAVAALLLAVAGLAALATFEAATRRAELGLRLALGATAADLRLLLVKGILGPVAVGITAGAIVAYWAASFLEAFMYQVDARDLRIYAGAIMLFAATAILAAWLPARRAARTDPASVLRSI
jgi:putative ABC transport system permease protein